MDKGEKREKEEKKGIKRKIVIFSSSQDSIIRKDLIIKDRKRKIIHLDGDNRNFRDQNIIDITRIIDSDPALGSLFDKLGILPLHEYKKSIYVALIGAIIGQMISFQQARKIRSNLYSLLMTDFNRDDIEKLSDKKLKSIGITEEKISIIRDVNAFLKDKMIDKDIILSLSDIKGIKDWTIKNTLLTSFTDIEVMLYNDVFINKRIYKLYGKDKSIKEISKNWIYKGIICWYFWRDF